MAIQRLKVGQHPVGVFIHDLHLPQTRVAMPVWATDVDSWLASLVHASRVSVHQPVRPCRLGPALSGSGVNPEEAGDHGRGHGGGQVIKGLFTDECGVSATRRGVG